jgi:hypothetical protein
LGQREDSPGGVLFWIGTGIGAAKFTAETLRRGEKLFGFTAKAKTTAKATHPQMNAVALRQTQKQFSAPLRLGG